MYRKTFLIISILLINIATPIKAAPGDLGISGAGSVVAGESINLTVAIPSGYIYDLNIKSNNPSSFTIAVSGGGQFCGAKCVEPTGTIQIKVTGISSGTSGAIVIDGFVSDLNGVERAVNTSKPIAVTNKPDPKPQNPLPSVDNTEANKKPGKTPAQIEEERIKVENDKLKAEEAAKEELKKVPLISEIEIISLSDKFSGEVLNNIETSKDVFDYEYTLPKRIDEFSLKANAPEDVTLTFDADYKFEEEENEKTVVVKASKGDIEQSFNIVVKRNIFQPVEKTVFNSSVTVYDDERLDSFIETIGAEKIDGTHYKFDDLLFQLVVDTDNKAKWLLLNEDLTDQAFGLIHLNAEGELLFILENDDLANETLYGEKYSKKELVIDERIAAIDPSLTFETSYKGTTFEDGVIVYAMNSKGIKGNHFISSDNSFTFAAVAFDQVNMTYKYVAWVSSIALIALLGALVLTKILNRNKAL